MPEKPLLHIFPDSRPLHPVAFPVSAISYLPDPFLFLRYPFIQRPERSVHPGPPPGLREPAEPVSEALTLGATGGAGACPLHMLESIHRNGLGNGPDPETLSERGDHE